MDTRSCHLCVHPDPPVRARTRLSPCPAHGAATQHGGDNGPVTVIAVSALVSLATVLLLSGAAKLAVPGTGRTILTTAPLPRALRAPWLQRALPGGRFCWPRASSSAPARSCC